MVSVLCINGPNLDQLGRRQPGIYGDETLGDLEARVVEWGRRLDFDVTCVQSNREGELIEAVHSARGMAGLIVNPGAFTHTSHALADAVDSVDVPAVEVHISNVRARDRWRRRSLIAAVASTSIYGRGFEGYRAALRHLSHLRAGAFDSVRYGPHPDQVLDVRQGESDVGVVLIHGGFWSDVWGRDITAAWAVDLADRGIASANIEFRRLGSGGGSVPTVNDAVTAITRAHELFGERRLVVVGHSTGAHLAVAAADLAPADRLVLVSGVLDYAAVVEGSEALDAFDPTARFDPMKLAPPTVPVTLIHGALDDVVSPRHSERYAEHLAAPSVGSAVDLIEGEGHFDILSARSDGWQRVIAAIG